MSAQKISLNLPEQVVERLTEMARRSRPRTTRNLLIQSILEDHAENAELVAAQLGELPEDKAFERVLDDEADLRITPMGGKR